MVRDPQAPDADPWRAFEPYWKNARFTGYSRGLRLAVRDLYGVEEMSPATLPNISRALRESNQAGVCRRLVKERSGIRACVQDDYWNAVPKRPANDFLLGPHDLPDIH